MNMTKKVISIFSLFFGSFLISCSESSSSPDEGEEDIVSIDDEDDNDEDDIVVGRSSSSKKKSSSSSETNAKSSSSSKKAEQEEVIDFPVKFSEVDPVNTVYDDHEGGDAGWVELYNTADTAVNLKGIVLTDSRSSLDKWSFGDVVIPPKSYMLVFLSGKDYKNYVAPSDTVDMIGPSCWSWTDAQRNEDDGIVGTSSLKFLPKKSSICFDEGGSRAFGGTMQFGENKELGWHSISFFVGTASGTKDDYVDLGSVNEILMTGFITKDRKLRINLGQSDLDDYKGWEKNITGTGDSSTTYSFRIPTGTKFPDLTHIFGTRFSPKDNEVLPLTFKITSFIARNRGSEPHSNFKAEKKGGSLYLVKDSKTILDSVVYPALPVGKSWSYGTDPFGEEVWGFATPTPYGITASKVATVQAESPQTELPPSGFYSEPINIEFPADKNVRCREGGYTPSTKSELVTSLTISKTTVIRCASYVPNELRSNIETRTYVFEPQPKTPVVFLTGNPKSLFDPDSGMYMEGPYAQEENPHFGANYWADREIPIFVELFEKGQSKPAFAKNAGFQIFGNYSRANAKKSVTVVFREKYGDKRLHYTLFPDFPELTKFKTFILRNNGGNFGADYIRDRLCSSISEGLGVDYQRGRGVVVYYNGEYFGIHSIRERSTEYYFETHYGMDPDEIDLLKADNSASAGSGVDYQALMNWLESSSLKSQANYDYVAEQIDVDNFLNYMHTELFVNNRDWPSNNLKKWRNTNPTTKWKWFIYDTDFGFGNEYSDFKNNIFEFATAEDGPSWPNGPASTLLLRKMLTNESFKLAFINRMATLLSMNFESSRLTNRINALMSEIQSEISRDQERWGLDASYMSSQLSNMKSFASTRQAVIRSELRDYFNLGSTTQVTLKTSGSGQILVHGLPLDQSSMSISFFEGTPVTVSAQGVGGMFVGWNDGVTSATRVIMPEEVSSLTANFR